MPVPRVMLPASAATRARTGTGWKYVNGDERRCWLAQMESKPTSRAARTCATCSAKRVTCDSSGRCWTARPMPNFIEFPPGFDGGRRPPHPTLSPVGRGNGTGRPLVILWVEDVAEAIAGEVEGQG